MKKLMFSFLLLVSAITFASAQDNSSYKATLKKMMEVSGSIQSYRGVVNQMITMFKQQQTKVPQEFWEEISLEMNKVAIDDLVGLTLPVYQKHLTEADLKAVIAFYETPAGRKFAQKTPMITQESMQAGQVWGKKLGETVVEKLKAKGYLKTL